MKVHPAMCMKTKEGQKAAVCGGFANAVIRATAGIHTWAPASRGATIGWDGFVTTTTVCLEQT
jgi:hypothetical protein